MPSSLISFFDYTNQVLVLNSCPKKLLTFWRATDNEDPEHEKKNFRDDFFLGSLQACPLRVSLRKLC